MLTIYEIKKALKAVGLPQVVTYTDLNRSDLKVYFLELKNEISLYLQYWPKVEISCFNTFSFKKVVLTECQYNSLLLELECAYKEEAQNRRYRRRLEEKKGFKEEQDQEGLPPIFEADPFDIVI